MSFDWVTSADPFLVATPPPVARRLFACDLYSTFANILSISAAVNARSVWPLTFPFLRAFNTKADIVVSSGASITHIMS
jgi:hypothetical protein